MNYDGTIQYARKGGRLIIYPADEDYGRSLIREMKADGLEVKDWGAGTFEVRPRRQGLRRTWRAWRAFHQWIIDVAKMM